MYICIKPVCTYTAKDTAQHTPLHVAVLRQHRGAVQTLLQLGAPPNELGARMFSCRWIWLLASCV